MEVKEKVEEKVGSNYNVKIHHVVKNNALELDGLTICHKESNISPNIYLGQYYTKYQNGESVESITSEIIQIYDENMNGEGTKDFNLNFAFEEIKTKIVYRIVNYSMNKKMLLNVPYIRFLDLAITFHCLVNNDANGIGTIRISNEYMQQWGTSSKELFKIAGDNTPNIFPANIRSMNEVIESIFKNDISQSIGDINLESWDDFSKEDLDMSNEDMMKRSLSELKDKQHTDMYILTNSNGINGASTMLYTNVMKEFSMKHNSDFYILPSSIHEVILVPYSENMNQETLKDMVIDVNQTQVPAEEILSNQVYIYHRSTNSIEI